MRTAFFHGFVAAFFASIAALVYNYVHSSLMLVDFSSVINTGSIIGACLFGCILASTGYFLLSKVLKKHTSAVFNILLLLATFASFISSFYVNLPMDVDSPEMFYGLSIPLHTFPALFWMATKPLFYKEA